MTARAIVDAIKGEAAFRFGVSVNEINGNSRKRPVARARQASMAIALEKLKHASLESVGAMFSRDHTTVMYARDITAQREQEFSDYPAILDAMRDRADLERDFWSRVIA